MSVAKNHPFREGLLDSAKIFALVFVPLLVAFVPACIQERMATASLNEARAAAKARLHETRLVAEERLHETRVAAQESLHKDYVGIAVSVLGKENKPDANVALRRWAVDVLAKDSPVPITASVRKDLENGTTTLGRVHFTWAMSGLGAFGLTNQLHEATAGLGAVGLVANLREPRCFTPVRPHSLKLKRTPCPAVIEYPKSSAPEKKKP